MHLNIENENQNYDRDSQNNPKMTPKTIKYFCQQQSQSFCPETTEKLSLHHKNYTAISSLQPYTNLLTIHLNNNKISKIQGLQFLHNLICLYLNNNLIQKIQNLDALINLEILNLSNNRIKKIQGLKELKKLSSFNISTNLLTDVNSIRELCSSEMINNLDLSDNDLECCEEMFQFVGNLGNIECLYLKGTPVSRGIKNYRKRLVAKLKKLRFLDDRPVQSIDHRLAEAWCKGGIELEKQQKNKIVREKQEQTRREIVQKREENHKVDEQDVKDVNFCSSKQKFPTNSKKSAPINKNQQIHNELLHTIKETEPSLQIRSSKQWNENYQKILEILLQKHCFDFSQVQPQFNMIFSEVSKKMCKPSHRFEIRELEQIWTNIEIKKRAQ